VQQRSEAKITYPFHFTNTCCSHPLHVDTELEPEDSVGIKRAAQRRLHYELGIPPEQVPLNSLMLMTRIHYLAQNYPDIRWGEHEVDYILICRADVDLDVNSNEVREVRYVSQTELKNLLAAADAKDGAFDRVTPWFKLLCTKWGKEFIN
jgi:isopentenyl-diphosphate delta-isomerase